jgi:hypothetical protein
MGEFSAVVALSVGVLLVGMFSAFLALSVSVLLVALGFRSFSPSSEGLSSVLLKGPMTHCQG